MSQLLIKMNSDSENPMRYQVGDVLEVRPDDFNGWSLAILPDYLVVRITGISFDEARIKYCGPDNIESPAMLSRWMFPVNELLTNEQLENISSADWIVPEFDHSVMVDKTGIV